MAAKRCRFCGETSGAIVSETVDNGHRATTRFNKGDGRKRFNEVYHHQACRDDFERANDEKRQEELDELRGAANAYRVAAFLAGTIR